MNIEEILNQLDKNPVLLLPEVELKTILEKTILVEEHNSKLGGMMRILEINGTTLFQEITDKGEIAVRKMEDKVEALNFINDRLDTYDRMWDGCGCRVDYYN